MTSPNQHDRTAHERAGLLRYCTSSLLALGLAGTAFAQSPAPSTTTASASGAATTDSTITMEAFTVTGYAESLSKSLNIQRASDANVQVISAEDAGKFPDTNLGESLSHLPGITVDRLFGEGERVSIQGTDPNLNRVLLNGEPVSSADWYILDNQSRQFNYLLLSPDVIGTAIVHLMPEAQDLEGSVGGMVDVHTINPFEVKPLTASLTLTGSDNDRSKKTEYSETGMIAWHDDAKKIGVLFGFEDNRDYLRRDGVEALAEETNTSLPVAGAGSLPGLPAGPFVTDEVVNTALFEQLRHHQGVNGTIMFNPTDQLSIELTGMFVKQTMNNMNFSYYIYPGDNWSGLPNVTNPTVTNGALTSYTINSAPLVIDAFNRAAVIKTQDYNAKVTYRADNFTLEGNAGMTRATGGTQHQFFGEWFIFATANVNENANQASFNVTSAPGLDPTGANVGNGQDFNGAGEPGFDYGNIASNPEVDDEKWFKLDATIPLKGPFTKILVGGRWSDHDAGETGNVVGVPGAYENGVGTANAPANGLGAIAVTEAPSNYLDGLPGITPSMKDHIVAPGYGSVANYIGGLNASTIDGGKSETLLQYFDSQPSASGAVFTSTPSFTIDEQISAAYVEGKFNFMGWTGDIGARYVDTKTTSGSYDLSYPGGPKFQTTSATYDNFLPSFNGVYELGNDQTLRFGVAEVIARPNTSAEANYVQLYDATLTGVRGSTGLNPYKSTNFDVAYTWYFTKNSYLQADFFYKDISNYIVNTTAPFQETDYSQPGNPTETYELSGPSNGGSAKSYGGIISFQQTFSNGLGFTANYTAMHTEGANGVLPFSSKNQLNLSPFFENKLGLIRLTYAWRDDYLSSTFNGTGTLWTKPFTELDANAEVYLSKNVSLVLTATNLLDETYAQYYKNPGTPSLFADAYKFGRGYTAAVRLKF